MYIIIINNCLQSFGLPFKHDPYIIVKTILITDEATSIYSQKSNKLFKQPFLNKALALINTCYFLKTNLTEAKSVLRFFSAFTKIL